ncbi:hypothetical protein PR048_031517 [Dryococelus australis]|uniref:Uncharacterized protein n=1 Tax=Dryococelus australis TaxID=614101 RepID=A0ABQ9G5I0_9NEOP|nr:hypothetical protein PR048_031517 [Dryococelus australis]
MQLDNFVHREIASAIKKLLDAVNEVAGFIPGTTGKQALEQRKREFVKFSKRFSNTLKEYFKEGQSNCSKMADEKTLLLTGSAEKQLNKGRTRKIRLSEWKDNKNKALRNSGKPYGNRKGTFVPGKCAPERKKMKFNLDISDKRGTHHNRPRAVSFDVKELVRDHISSMPAQESHYSRSTSGKLYLTSKLCVERMYDLFKESRPNIKCSCSLYRDIFRSEFKLRFGPPRSNSCSYCDELYIHLVAAETEDEQKRIMYHPKQWLEVIVNASPAFSAYYMDKEDFIDLSAIEGMFKKQSDLKITSFHWIQFSSEEPNTVRTRVSHNILQPWHSYVTRPLPRGRKHLRPPPTVLPQLYEEAIALKKKHTQQLHLPDMCRFLPIQYRDFYENLCAVE